MLRFLRCISKTSKPLPALWDNAVKSTALIDQTKVKEIRDRVRSDFLEKERQFMKQLPEWSKRDKSHKSRYGVWNPTRKLNRQQMQDLRTIKDLIPQYKTIDLANMFKISPEAIRRILKSNWVPKDGEVEDLKRREEQRKLQKLKWQQSFKEANKSLTTESKMKNIRPSGPNIIPPNKPSTRRPKTINRGLIRRSKPIEDLLD